MTDQAMNIKPDIKFNVHTRGKEIDIIFLNNIVHDRTTESIMPTKAFCLPHVVMQVKNAVEV